MLRLEGEKMSKSEGNIDQLSDALDRWGAETLIMFMLQAHYASPVDYDDAALERARAACETMRNRLRSGAGQRPRVRAAVCEALDDDFSTPRALAVLSGPRRRRATPSPSVLGVLGLGALAVAEQAPAEVEELAAARDAARAERDFAESDRLREAIAELRLGGARHRRGPRPRPP